MEPCERERTRTVLVLGGALEEGGRRFGRGCDACSFEA
jgi:hypothetical protein